MSVCGVPPGADFVRTLFAEVTARMVGQPPEALARVRILVPSRRMQRRLKGLFEESGAWLLPRIGLVTDVAPLLPEPDGAVPVPPLQRILELKALVAKLVEMDGRLSPGMVIDLTESLARLLDEMQGEGVDFDALETVVPGEMSAHWERSLAFLRAIRGYSETLAQESPDAEALHRRRVERLCAAWEVAPPDHPVIVAGSTGSRATTRMLMGAVARLPQGTVVLPGFDFDMPDAIWADLSGDRLAEDHPQYRFAAFLGELGLARGDVACWGDAPDAARNALVSLSLRPAPVTDQWMTEGPRLGDLRPATRALSLIEAESPKEEAAAIALAIRHAVEDGKSVALIAPDATLARRVTAALGRWDIRPDDSGGMPLSLTPPGRFLRQVAGLAGKAADPVALVALLKHPMTRFGAERGEHMLMTQTFELFLRRQRVAAVDAQIVRRFGLDDGERRGAWCDWLASALDAAARLPGATLGEAMACHMALVESFAGPEGMLELGREAAGEAVTRVLDGFRQVADRPGFVTFSEYFRLLERALAADSARPATGTRPDVTIWGTLEARVQGADLVILGGLVEGVWPEQPAPDPWLNREIRREIGLLLPERQIGLAAHDFQQAVAAPEAILTRARRSEGSETVPSRWLNRLTNLLDGLGSVHGPEALAAMRARGARYLRSAALLDQPGRTVAPAPRPAPAPPVDMRPRSYAVTEIQHLIRDPYTIYAKRILRLAPLDPLSPEVDAKLKGTVFHRILELFFDPGEDFDDAEAAARRLRDIARRELERQVHQTAVRADWLGHLSAIGGILIEGEQARRAVARGLARESKGLYPVPGTGFELRGKADRIDRMEGGGLVIYDYKTGGPPSARDILHFDRQLVLEAVMAEAGAFEGVPAERVAQVVHVGVGRSPQERVTLLEGENETVTVSGHIADFLTGFADAQTGYPSRRAMEKLRWDGDYDHLARFGEWDESQDAQVERLT